MIKTAKTVLILIGIAIISYAAYEFKKTLSLEEIELKLGSHNLSEQETQHLLGEVFRYFEKKEPSSLVKSKIDSTIAANSFLTQTDSSLISNLQALSSAETEKSFFQDNKIPLYGLHCKILNEVIYLKYHKPDQAASIRQYEELANSIAEQFEKRLKNTFLPSQVKFYRELEETQLKEKLELEAYWQNFYQLHFENPRSALKFLGPGTKLAQKLGDKKREIDFHSRLQFILSESFGMTNIGLALGKYLLDETDSLGYELKKALVLYYNGNVLIAKGQFRQALKQFEMSKDLYSKFDYRDTLRMLYERMGVAHRRLGQFNLALQSYEKMNQISKKLNKPQAQIRYQQGLGAIYADMSQYAKAESTYFLSLHLARNLKDKQLEATALISLGALFHAMGDYEKAMQFHQNAWEKLRDEEAPFLIAEISGRLIELHAMNNEIEKAKKTAANAIEHLSKYDFGLPKGQTLLNIGELQMQIGDLESALKTLTQGLQIFRELEVITSQVGASNLIGETQRRLGNYEQALETLNKASDLAAKLPNLRKYIFSTDFYLARVHLDLNQIELAEDFLQKSISSVKQIAFNLINYEQRYNFSQKIQPIFEQMVLLQLSKSDPEDALFFAELERAQVFRLQLQNQTEPPRITHKAGLTSRAKDNQKFDLKALQSQLADSIVVVEYEVTDSSLVIWFTSSDKFHSEQVDISRHQLEQLISKFRKTLKKNSIRLDFNASFKQAAALSEQLYQFLISPIETYLSQAKLIHFIPDETLYYIPFAALQNPKNKFLIEQFEIAYSPSAAILQNSLSKMVQLTERPRDYKFLGIAADLKLKFAVQEAVEVAKLCANSKTLIGPEATEQTAKFEIQNGPKVVLFSSHSRVNPKRPNQSAILLNKDPNGVAASANDGSLTVLEIMSLKCNATELVYLSACETGSGRLYKGEGIVGLQRGFMLTGAKTVIANLWQIQDEAAKNLTVNFFEKWFTGEYTKTEALRLAQLKAINALRKNPIYAKAHPYFWAPVVLTGAYN